MTVLDRLRGKLVVSCQPVDDGPMDRPEIVVAMAQAAINGGAAGIRVEGVTNARHVCAAVDVPVIGIVKCDLPGFDVRITPRVADVLALIDAGVDIVAFDATDVRRPETVPSIVAAIHGGKCLAMADCATLEDGTRALALGVEVLGTTLSGYVGQLVDQHAQPDFELVTAFKNLGAFVMAEGRYNSPELAAMAIRAGADCVTVGSALTRLERMTGWFANEVDAATLERRAS